ncbi:uncharacterized protein [Clytia hemisphaerica]|uniref:adenylate kinase n=1 Tax=Clytia hemisphaerica TaxID=252671 RepID=A0A7M6DQ28_9CNID
MSNHSMNAGGLKEAKEYMMDKEIPQLFESMMTALMYKKPEDHIEFLETCLNKAKEDPKIRWHSFIQPLPPIPKATEKIRTEAESPQPFAEDVLASPKAVSPVQNAPSDIVQKKTEASLLAEQVFNKHMQEIDALDNDDEKPWYADYTEKYIDTSAIQEKPIVFVLGGPGSGKGTQCAKIVEKYGFLHLSAGDLLRAEVKKGSEIGAKIDQAIKEGQLVPQDVTICLLKEAMVAKADSKGFLIDGFPREIKQGKQFERQVAFASLMLNYECPDEVLTERLIERGKHSGRVDDNIESIKKRLVLFHEKTSPVVQHYSEIVSSIQANRSIDEVFEDTCKALEQSINSQPSTTDTSLDLAKPIVFILGAKSSGREKQCELLSHRYSLHHVSLDTILKEDSEKFQDLMISYADNIPMGVALEAINKRIHNNKDNNGFIIDGFPRTLEEAVCFEMEICPASFVVYFECPDDVLLRRQLGENAESEEEEAAKKNLESFHSRMTPILLKYPDKLKIINSARSEDIIFKETCDFVDFLIAGQKSQVINEEQISPEQQKDIESAVQDIVNEIAPQQSSNDEPQVKSEGKPQVEGEEDHMEVQEEPAGESGNKKLIYQEMLKNKKVIFVAGSPGTGKSTQCQKIAESFGYAHISKDLVLREIEAGTERGLKIVEFLKNKESVPDKLAFDILGEAMLEMDGCHGYLMEGYPANVQQISVFEDEFKLADMVLHLTCPEIVASERFLSRGQPGDTHENYQERLDLYKEQTLPMLDLKVDLVKEIIVSGNPEEIFEEISKHFTEENSQTKPAEETKQEVMAGDLSNKNIVFVLGGPGSGKGTQCAKIVEKYGFCHLSTGDLLRAEVSSGSARAEEMKEIMAKGELIPLETILALLKEAMLKNSDCKGFILDGYPRDVPQGEKFEESVGKCKFILYFHCTNECMTERLLGRAKTSGRVDDNIDTIKLRLKTFENQTLPILDKYSDRIKKIDAMRGVDDIFADVCKELDTL